MGCHAIDIVKSEFLHVDHALVLWLVPTIQIRDQTLAALKDESHPYRQALKGTINGPITVLDITEALFVQRNVLDSETCIIVSTLAALRIEDTDGRRIYDENGSLMPHFTGLNDAVLDSLEKNQDGKIIYSLANVLRARRPMVIMDEAHNARTNLSFETLARFSPSCVIEFTATPQSTHHPQRGEFASNVLVSVSAAELNAESMIKMPIRLETKNDWKEVIADAIGKRKQLESIARKEERETGEHIRPIVLFQAQPRYQDRETINVDILLQSLMEDFKIPRDEIAIHIGDQKELDGVNLFDPTCKIKFVITVSALKEGWDCSYAYVLCSVAEIGSATAVEQLVGRILRLPNAKKKNHQELNKAYAYVSSTKFAETLEALTDALIENGFEKFEAPLMIEPPTPEPDLFDFIVTSEIVEEEPDLDDLPEEIKKKVTYQSESKTLEFTGSMSEEEKEKIEKCFKTEKGKKAVWNLFTKSRRKPSPSDGTGEPRPEFPKQQTKTTFSVPYLVYKSGEQIRIFEETIFLNTNWELATCDYKLSEEDFSLKHKGIGQVGEITVTDQGKVESRFIEDLTEQLSLYIDNRGWTIAELANWLDRKIPHPDISIKQSTLFIYKVIQYLIKKREFDLDTLVYFKYRLRDAVEKLIDRHRQQVRKQAYQTCLNLGDDTLFVTDEFVFTFDKDVYPASWYYDGHFKFNKHYHKLVGELKNTGEEFRCAQIIDSLPQVKHWIRNIDGQEKYSFWLQKSKGRFYPDFVAELNDGRLLVVEYKGDHIKDNEDSEEKKAIGELWAARSNGKCLFYWAIKDNVENLRTFIS